MAQPHRRRHPSSTILAKPTPATALEWVLPPLSMNLLNLPPLPELLSHHDLAGVVLQGQHQRLAFLGDRWLDWAVSDTIVSNFPNIKPDVLNVRRSPFLSFLQLTSSPQRIKQWLVCNRTFGWLARGYHLDTLDRHLNDNGKLLSPQRASAGVFEAYVGILTTDGQGRDVHPGLRDWCRVLFSNRTFPELDFVLEACSTAKDFDEMGLVPRVEWHDPARGSPDLDVDSTDRGRKPLYLLPPSSDSDLLITPIAKPELLEIDSDTEESGDDEDDLIVLDPPSEGAEEVQEILGKGKKRQMEEEEEEDELEAETAYPPSQKKRRLSPPTPEDPNAEIGDMSVIVLDSGSDSDSDSELR